MSFVIRKETFAKLFFFVSCAGLFVYASLAFYTFHAATSYIYIIQKYQNHLQGPPNEDSIKTGRYNNDLKYILVWSIINETMNYYGEGTFPFLDNKCTYKNCYLTTNRYLLNNDIKNYDANIFNSQTLKNWNKYNMPSSRLHRQKYIFYSMESSDEAPICTVATHDYFNLTCLYKLDSDIVTPFIEVRDFGGNIVAPKVKVKWETSMVQLIEAEVYHLKRKKRAMAWIANQCHTRSNVLAYAKKLQETFRRNSLQFDIYGCGLLQCPKEGCWKALQRDYYFYFAAEDGKSEDYVTREVLKGYNYEVVPVVLGGADYRRFLPEGSYINAAITSNGKLVALIDYIIKNPKTYRRFFRWKTIYVINSYRMFNSLCQVCQYLNDDKLYGGVRVKKNFRQWWYGKPLFNRCILKGAESISHVLSYVNITRGK